ncbi:HTH domain-containing protein [Phyllobacterium sp. YR531]|uniref:helix-turn-helix transcriptional regulator n=1 Tax=Phyllobacterium sp. YR531 TaxID=1144343 RepID=UPI00026F7E7E|nr:HTH domain-containing protein [Phyllobacterium sp. YR531]EJN02103.1 putative transcriptional regulator [Phyllobacterium sp. YR531]
MADRSHRLVKIVNILGEASKPLSAEALGESLRVASRTIYRDIASLQQTGVPIEGSTGSGYIMRSVSSVPPITFTTAELEIIIAGLCLIGQKSHVEFQPAVNSLYQKMMHAGQPVLSNIPHRFEELR